MKCINMLLRLLRSVLQSPWCSGHLLNFVYFGYTFFANFSGDAQIILLFLHLKNLNTFFCLGLLWSEGYLRNKKDLFYAWQPVHTQLPKGTFPSVVLNGDSPNSLISKCIFEFPAFFLRCFFWNRTLLSILFSCLENTVKEIKVV